MREADALGRTSTIMPHHHKKSELGPGVVVGMCPAVRCRAMAEFCVTATAVTESMLKSRSMWTGLLWIFHKVQEPNGKL